MKILLLDNYDSFTYNTVNMLRKFKESTFAVRQPHAIDFDEVAEFDKIIFSPGPGIPEKGDHMWQLIDRFKTSKSFLGICLGFHAIAMYFGVELRNMHVVVHGQSRQVEVLPPADPVFCGIKTPFRAGLYHSWTHREESYPDRLRVTARSEDGIIMAIAHQDYRLCGFQYHPESVMTPAGFKMIENWLKM